MILIVGLKPYAVIIINFLSLCFFSICFFHLKTCSTDTVDFKICLLIFFLLIDLLGIKAKCPPSDI